MKVFVSVDLEGVTGVTESPEMTVGGRDHERTGGGDGIVAASAVDPDGS